MPSESQTFSGEEEMARLLRMAWRDGLQDQYAGKRCWPRFLVGMPLEMTADPGGQRDCQPVTMHNVSDGGFAFWSKRRILIKTRIYVREFSKDNSRVWLPVFVTHCTTGIRGYLVGVKLDSDYPPDSGS